MHLLHKNSVGLSLDPSRASICRSRLTPPIVLVTALFAVSPLLADGSGSKKVRCGEQSLQRAIDKARPGSTLIIIGSCSDGPYVVEKDLQLIGQGAELSAPSGSDHVLNARGVTLRLETLTINAQNVLWGIVARGSSVLAHDIEIHGATEAAIGGEATSLVELGDSQLLDNGAGVVVSNSSNLSMRGCRVENSTHVGIVLDTGSSALIVNSEIVDGHDIGILVDRFSVATLFDVSVDRNSALGIWVADKNAMLNLRGCEV